MSATPVVQNGIPAKNAKSYPYDHSLYTGRPQGICGSIAAAANSSFAFTSFTNKLLKSLTVVPTTAAGANDQLFLNITSVGPQVYGTATASDQRIGTGTVMGTKSSKVTISSTIGGGAGTALVGLGTQVAGQPTYFAFSGGTFTVVVTANEGTNTQAGYVAPTGPLGGIPLFAGDVVVLSKGTDTAAIYQVEFEASIAPGSNVTL